MNKKDYMRELSYRLRRLPKEDFDKAMDYFEEYFEEAGPDQEAQAIRDLGSPQDAARELILSLASEKSNAAPKGTHHRLSALWIGLLALFAAPIALPLALVVCAVSLSLLLCVALLYLSGLFLSVCAAGCGLFGIVGGVVLLFQSFADGLSTLGIAFLCTGIGILCAMAMIKAGQLILAVVLKLLRKISKKGGCNHEKKEFQ